MTKKILIVDDESDVALSVELTLESEDYEILHVDSGKKCIELMENKQYTPDLILLDIMMPIMNGWELFDKIKENSLWEKIPVVFLTARVDYTAEKAGKFLGDDYIEKPYDPQDLKKRIKLVLDKT